MLMVCKGPQNDKLDRMRSTRYFMAVYNHSQNTEKSLLPIPSLNIDSRIKKAQDLAAVRNFVEALSAYDEVLAAFPDNDDLRMQAGATAYNSGDAQRAFDYFKSALKINPRNSGAYSNIGVLLKQAGRYEEAVQYYIQSIAISPSALSYGNLGNLYRSLYEISKANGCYLKGLELDNKNSELLNNFGLCLINQGKIAQGIELYTRGLLLNPNHKATQHNFLLGIQYNHTIDIYKILARHSGWGKSVTPPNGPSTVHPNNPSPDRTLRIGFVSADMGKHPVGYFLQQLFANHDARLFSLYCYSDRTAEDHISEKLREYAHSWTNCLLLSDEELFQRIATDEIDILIDLAGHTAKNRLRVFAQKPAPVQCTWAGYVGTTGLPAMDYIVSDRWQTPDGFEAYSVEAPLRLADGYITYTAPDYTPDVGPLPALHNGYVTFGCFNNISKINDAVISLWGGLLRRMPNAKLLMITHALKDQPLNAQFRERFTAAGANESQLLLEGSVPHAELLDAYNRVDIGLDPFPYSGGLTTCESIYMGVPVVTLPGRRFCSRHSASHLSNVGLADWVVTGREEYIAKALQAAKDLNGLAALRAGMRAQVAASPLCDGKRFAESFQKAMRRIWKMWCAGQNTPQKED